MEKLPKNTKVIVRNNEDEPYHIGTLIRYEIIGQMRESLLPIVKFDEDGKEYMCGGIVLEYDPILISILDKLTPKEQWDILAVNYRG